MNNKKWIVVLIIVILIGIVIYFGQSNSESEENEVIDIQATDKVDVTKDKNIEIPTICVDQDQGEPVITAVSKYYVSVGEELTIEGCNLAGFEGDKNIWIESDQGVRGIIYGDESSTAKSINIVLESKICQQDNSYSGLPCKEWLNLESGKYKVYVNTWTKESNKVEIEIK